LKKDKEKANLADEEYRKTVITLAKHQDKYYQEDMPALLKEFENFERARILYTKKSMNSFVTLQSKLAPEWQQASDRFRKKVDAIDAKIDLDTYVNSNRPEQSQPPARAQYMSWDGTLIEDLGPRRDGAKTNSTPVNNQPVKQQQPTATPTFSTPRSEPEKTVQNNNVKQQEVKSFVQPAVVSQPVQTGGKMLVALFSYDATEDTEITFQEGDTIQLIEENESGWWKGKLISTGAVGLFPSNFVEEKGKAQPVQAQAVQQQAVVQQQPQASGGEKINGDFIALYDYDAEDEFEISIKENDLLFVETETDGWYYGYRKVEPSKKGNFPSNFVERK